MERKIINENLKINWENLSVGQSLGNGLMGEVYYSTYENKEYALKISKKNKKLCHQVSNEILYMNLLKNHPHITKYIDHCIISSDEEYEFKIVMELAKMDLSQFMNENPYYFLEEDKLINFIIQILSAIVYFNINNLAHRDLKIHNILLFENEIFKISDFGCMIDIIKNDSREFRGIPSYRSPELIKNKTNQNYHKSDFYSLGLIVLMLIGVLPNNDPSELTSKKDKQYEFKLNELLNKATAIVSDNNIIDFLSSSLNPNYNIRLTSVDMLKKLKSYWEFSKSLPYSFDIFSYEEYFINGEKFKIISNKKRFLTSNKNKVYFSEVFETLSSEFTFRKIGSGKYLIVNSENLYLSYNPKNLTSFSKFVSHFEEWQIFYYQSENVYFFRNFNLLFLEDHELNSDSLLTGIIFDNSKFIIEKTY